VGRYLLTPEITPSGRFYEVRGQATYGCLLTNLLSVKGVVPPGGVRVVWHGFHSGPVLVPRRLM
jgi:hypothetical protein